MTNCHISQQYTGILGREIVKELSRSPEEWKTIYALSRSKKDEYPSHVVHKHIDLLSSADQMAKDLQGVEAEYIFFSAYLQKDTEQENWEVNGMYPPIPPFHHTRRGTNTTP